VAKKELLAGADYCSSIVLSFCEDEATWFLSEKRLLLLFNTPPGEPSGRTQANTFMSKDS